MDKIRVAFLNLGSLEWTGGLHYLQNLLYALSLVENSRVEPVVFVGTRSPDKLVSSISPYATIIRSRLFDRRSPIRIISRLVGIVSGSHFILDLLLKKHRIQVVSHSNVTGTRLPYKTINWIPDFQIMHLPEMFPAAEIKARLNLYKRIITTSNLIVVSSINAHDDLLSFMPGFEKKVRVLSFVSQVESDRADKSADLDLLKKKYSLPDHFFYLPNQFWKHKNHRTVFEAVRELKGKGKEINIVCSGYMNDHRNLNHVDELKEFVSTNGLDKNISFLGLIDYHEVFQLMIQSVAVINPSLFEGWSSTVEETKSIGKMIVLSDIPIHREQKPADSVYFPCHNYAQLAIILAEQWAERSENSGKLSLDRQRAADILRKRTIVFGKIYHQIVSDLVSFS